MPFLTALKDQASWQCQVSERVVPASAVELAAQYAAVSRELAQAPHDFRRLSGLAAEAEAAYKAARAKRRLSALAQGEARSQGNAEDVADADDHVADLHMAFLTCQAAAEACKQSIYSLRARLSFGQSLISAEKEVDRQHALSGGFQR